MEKTRKKIFQKIEKHLGIGLFSIFLVIGLLTYQRYGLTWDADAQREIGQKNYEYVFLGHEAGWERWHNKDYGAVFELPLYYAEQLFGLTDTQDVFFFRHFAVHLFFLIGALFFFKLVDLLYDNKLLAAIGFLMLVLHPRIYGHSFINTKDLPFLSMYIIAMYMTAIAFRRKTIRNGVLLGISIALVVNMRILGIMIPTLVFAMVAVDLFREHKVKVNLLFGGTIALVSSILLYVIWPYLWGDPFGNFQQIFENMSKFRWNGSVLFDGKMIKSTDLPWTYMPTWFGITTPILYLVVGIGSFLLVILRFLKKPLLFIENNLERNNIIFAATFLGPVLMVILLHSVVYDGWRHLFFIYPSFVLIGIFGLNFLLKKHLTKWVVGIFLLVFSFVGWSMVEAFPNEHVLFNRFVVGENDDSVRKRFDLDYWGVSYKQALEYLLEIDSSDEILVTAANYPGKSNKATLSESQRKRIRFVSKDEATYFISNYRYYPEDYPYSSIHKIIVGGNTINEIFKLK